MRHRLHLSALVAMSLIGATTSVFAQGTAAGGAPIGTVPGIGGMPPVGATPANPGSAGISSAPGGSSTTTTGMGTGMGHRFQHQSQYRGHEPTGGPQRLGAGYHGLAARPAGRRSRPSRFALHGRPIGLRRRAPKSRVRLSSLMLPARSMLGAAKSVSRCAQRKSPACFGAMDRVVVRAMTLTGRRLNPHATSSIFTLSG